MLSINKRSWYLLCSVRIHTVPWVNISHVCPFVFIEKAVNRVPNYIRRRREAVRCTKHTYILGSRVRKFFCKCTKYQICPLNLYSSFYFFLFNQLNLYYLCCDSGHDQKGRNVNSNHPNMPFLGSKSFWPFVLLEGMGLLNLIQSR